MRDVLKDGKAMGKQKSKEIETSITNFEADDILPDVDKGKKFDSTQAREMMITKQSPKSDVSDFLLSHDVQHNIKANKSFSDNEYFLLRANDIENDFKINEVGEVQEFEIVKCSEGMDLTPITIKRNLKVIVTQTVNESNQRKICNGHRIGKQVKLDYKSQKEFVKFRRDLEADPSIKSLTFEPFFSENNKFFIFYTIIHVDNTTVCDAFHIEQDPPIFQEVEDKWTYANEASLSLIESPDCTLVKQECLDAKSKKTINGKEVERKCWTEKLSFICRNKGDSDCAKIKGRKCDLIERMCLKQGNLGCSLWEHTFKCYTKIIRKIIGENENPSLEGDNWEVIYEPNSSFGEVTSKLAVFEEIEKEMQIKQATADSIHIFEAKKMKCSKSFASEVFYDCCFAHAGLIEQIGLAKCNEYELALADMRGQDLCHYVGKYSKSALGVKTEDKHVYCCFGSKLARIINEEGRSQLGRGWGTAKNPDCNGFTIDELGRLDFTLLDLKEVSDDYSKRIPESLQDRLGDFQNRLKEKIERNPDALIPEDKEKIDGLSIKNEIKESV